MEKVITKGEEGNLSTAVKRVSRTSAAFLPCAVEREFLGHVGPGNEGFL